MAEKFWVDDTRGFPCKDCQERHLACWQECERYKEAKRNHIERKRQKTDERDMNRVWYNVRLKNYRKRSHNTDPDRREF